MQGFSAGELEQRANGELVAHDRIETRKRLVEDDELGSNASDEQAAQLSCACRATAFAGSRAGVQVERVGR